MTAEAIVPVAERETHLARVQQRWAELDKNDLHKRLKKTSQTVDPEVRARLLNSAKNARSAKGRVFWLRQEVNYMVKPMEPLAACRSGCSHCCHIGVLVSETEASVIGRAIGRKPVDSPRARAPADLLKNGVTPEVDAWRADVYFGVPCTFLDTSGRCSIYEERPLACRMQLNLDRDDLLCRLVPDQLIPVPYLNMMTSLDAQTMVIGPNTKLADIRDWFPTR
jgi:Fe-S-cluster containining protein